MTCAESAQVTLHGTVSQAASPRCRQHARERRMIGRMAHQGTERRSPTTDRTNARIALAGVAYFAMAFAAGFLLGTLRVFLIVPHTGELTAVALELPIMLAVSAFAAGVSIRWFRVPPQAADRLMMGVVGFVLLQVAEIALGLVGFGRSFQDQLAALCSASGLLGLAGQVAFALFPMFIGRTGWY
jgi:hypothetical protein